MGLHLFDMEWNAKWDWENYGGFVPKPLESPKKMQQQLSSDWMVADEGAQYFGVSNLNDSSSKSSTISVSTEASAKEKGFIKLGNVGKKGEIMGSEVSGNSPPLEASVGSFEPSISLELGKRAFFDNSVIKSTSSHCQKKPKSSSSSAQNVPLPRCLAEGCNADLATAKEYHRKHRVCDSHSKAPKVIIRGLEHRFCQQCSRFHSLSEFDEKKRSCRKKLSEHNARRRKPPAETIRFSSVGPLASFYGSEGGQQGNFMLSNTLLLQPPRGASSPSFNTRFNITKGSSLKGNGEGSVSKSKSIHKVSNPGSKGNPIPSQFNAGYGRALSLLSTTNSLPWISTGQLNLMQEDYNNASANHHLMQNIPEGISSHSSSPEFWLSSSSRNQTSLRSQSLAATSNLSFQESYLIGGPPPYEAADFSYSNILN